MLASSTLASTSPPAFANPVPHTATRVNVDRTTTASTVKTSKQGLNCFICKITNEISEDTLNVMIFAHQEASLITSSCIPAESELVEH